MTSGTSPRRLPPWRRSRRRENAQGAADADDRWAARPSGPPTEAPTPPTGTGPSSRDPAGGDPGPSGQALPVEPRAGGATAATSSAAPSPTPSATPTATPTDSEALPGATLVNVVWAGTGVFVAMAIAGVTVPDLFAVPAAVVDGVLFVIGCIAFFWAFIVGVARSRDEDITVPALFFLHGSAPSEVRQKLFVAVAIQIVVAAATAAIRPFTESAFGILVPVFGLGLTALWGARHGTFPARRVEARPGRGRRSSPEA
jgi:hypothetical protein